MTVLMSPDMANFSGNVHGGAILKLLDQAAYACAARYAGRYVVTLSVDQVTFLQPIHVGELVTLLASVNYTGRSSMEIGIKVITEPLDSPEGKKTRVRAGPFASREAAEKALEKMKRIGVGGVVAAKQ